MNDPADARRVFSVPQDFRSVIYDLHPLHWPPTDEDLQAMAEDAARFISLIDDWETQTHGEDVLDVELGRVSTPDARRLLAREINLGAEGDMAVALIPEEEGRVGMELRADVKTFQGILKKPELLLFWQDENDEEQLYAHPLPAKGPHWYMLAQLRDDMREDRLVALS